MKPNRPPQCSRVPGHARTVNVNTEQQNRQQPANKTNIQRANTIEPTAHQLHNALRPLPSRSAAPRPLRKQERQKIINHHQPIITNHHQQQEDQTNIIKKNTPQPLLSAEAQGYDLYQQDPARTNTQQNHPRRSSFPPHQKTKRTIKPAQPARLAVKR